MKVIVTCGPSYEPIDEVRRLTNFSTGRLGIALANALVQNGWEVLCLKGDQATCADPLYGSQLRTFSTNQNLVDQLLGLSQGSSIHAVFHAAALCDFRVSRVVDSNGKPVSSPKYSTRNGELSLVLQPTVKVLPLLRNWFPQAKLVGWKYELSGTVQDALAMAHQQLKDCQTDACVLNGAAYGPGFALCEKEGQVTRWPDLAALTQGLVQWLRGNDPFLNESKPLH